MKAKELITHWLSSFIASLIPHSCTVTVHKVWQILQEHFNQMDMSAQYLLCQQCKSYTWKILLTPWATLHNMLFFCEHLIDAGMPWGKTDAIYHMLRVFLRCPSGSSLNLYLSSICTMNQWLQHLPPYKPSPFPHVPLSLDLFWLHFSQTFPSCTITLGLYSLPLPI
jgi:hypothetical protein